MTARLQAGDRFRHIDSREGRVIERQIGHELLVEYDEGGRAVIFEGFLERIPGALATGGRRDV